MKPYIATTLLLALTALPASANQKREKRERPREHHKERCDHERRHDGFDGGFLFAPGFPASPAPEAPVYIPETNPGPDQLSVNGTVYEIDGGNNVALASKAPEPAQPRMTRQQHIDKMRQQAAQWRELAERARRWAREARSPEDRKMWEDTADYEEEQARHLDEQIERQKEYGERDRAREDAANAASAPSVAMATPGPAASTGLPPSTGTRTPTTTGTTTPPTTGTNGGTPPSTGTGTNGGTPPSTPPSTPPNTGTGTNGGTPPSTPPSTPPNTGTGTNGGTPPNTPTRTPPTRESQGEWNKDMAAEVATTALGTQMTGSEGIGGAQAAGAALTVAYQQKQTDDRNVPRTDRTNREIRDTLDHGHYSELRGEPRNVWVQTIINLLTGNW